MSTLKVDTIQSSTGASPVTINDTLNVAGNTAVTGTLSASGVAAVGGSTSTDIGLNIRSAGLTSVNQYGMALMPVGTSAATSSLTGAFVRTDTAVAAFTVTNAYGVYVDNPSKGAGSSITTFNAFYVPSLSAGGTNYAFRSAGPGLVSIGDTTDATSTTAASLKTAGGLGVAKKTYCGDNIVMASGKGIDFSATSDGSGTTTSEVLSDYEEGTWTPTIGSGSGTITTVTATGSYVKVGRMVHATVNISITNAGTGAGALTFTVPFTSNVSGNSAAGSGVETAAVGFTGTCYLGTNSVTVSAYKDGFTTPIGTGNGLIYSIVYQTA